MWSNFEIDIDDTENRPQLPHKYVVKASYDTRSENAFVLHDLDVSKKAEISRSSRFE